MLKRIKIKVKGIHCKSCKTLIETEIDVLEGVKDIKVDYLAEEAQIEFDDQKISLEKISKEIDKLGYETEEQKKEKLTNREWIGALLILFIAGYLIIKNFGLLEVLSKLNEQGISYWLIFFIGFLVSFHCIGMCGGLVVAYSVRQKVKNKGKYRAHWQYNLGRFISYTIIGGILGGFGSFFAINPIFTGAIILFAGFFMVLMGLSLLTNFKWLEKIKLKTPSFIARFLYSQRHSKNPKGPFIIGLLNGFMPCGPLQAMQFYALASGSVFRGSLSMGIYALGTVPLMFGFGSFISLISREKINQIMKFSGIVVIILGLFMFNRGLINFNHGFSFSIPKNAISQNKNSNIGDTEEYQIIEMDLTYQGYSPNVLFIKKDIPVRWIINVEQMSGCTDEIILEDYNIRKKLEYGENIIEFIPDKLGDIKFSCWMKMVWGKFVVTDNNEVSSLDDLNRESLDLPQTSSCGCGCSN